MRRSCRSSATAARGVVACSRSAVPQLEQNAAAAGCSVPQPGHVRESAAPHVLQNRASADCSDPQSAHTTGTRRVYGSPPEAPARAA